MRKPDNIPQDVWDEAKLWLRRIDNLDIDELEGTARAILAERERCAKIADDYEAVWKRAVAPIEDGAIHRQSAGRDIAYAIRAGGQP